MTLLLTFTVAHRPPRHEQVIRKRLLSGLISIVLLVEGQLLLDLCEPLRLSLFLHLLPLLFLAGLRHLGWVPDHQCLPKR